MTNKINILLTEHGGRPPCYKQLMNYNFLSFHNTKKIPHPVAMFNSSWGEITRGFSRGITLVKKIQNDTYNPNHESISEIIDAHRNLIFRCAEFVEIFEKNIPNCLEHRLDFSGGTSSRKSLSMPCNRIKHNHNRISYVQQEYKGAKVSGYALYNFHNDTLIPNSEFHNKRRAFSFNVELRRIVCELYFYALHSGTKIGSLSTSHEEPRPMEKDERTIKILSEISSLPIFGFHWENKTIMPEIILSQTHLKITKNNGQILPLPHSATLMVNFEGDGVTRKFSVP